jgi:hypothetical protein
MSVLAFVLYDRMAGYGVEPTRERPIDAAGKRLIMADQSPTTERHYRVRHVTMQQA